MEAVDLIAAFLDENGYKPIHKITLKNHSPQPGEYYSTSTLSIINHIHIFCKHSRWELTLTIFNDGLIDIHINKSQSPDVLERVELPTRKAIKLSSPKSLEILKRFL